MRENVDASSALVVNAVRYIVQERPFGGPLPELVESSSEDLAIRKRRTLALEDYRAASRGETRPDGMGRTLTTLTAG